MANSTPQIIEPSRIKAFANFFKNYMSVATIVVASLPIPIAAFKLIPTYSSQTAFLSTYTSLFCFLTLGFLFHSRHRLARWMFPNRFRLSPPHKSYKAYNTGKQLVRVLPLILIVLSVIFIFSYHFFLRISVEYVKEKVLGVTEQAITSNSFLPVNSESALQFFGTTDIKASILNSEFILNKTDQNSIPYDLPIIATYIAVFVAAETAFILMALKEYLQDLIGIEEIELIQRIDLDEVRQTARRIE